MNGGQIELIGYHGTTREFADSILESNKFKMSYDEEEWLGSGVYFFENDIKQAYYYCVRAKKYKLWAIIRSEIQASIIIDLIDTETFEFFKEISKRIKDRYHKRSDGRPRILTNAVILNIMYKAKPYDLVKGVFQVPKTDLVDRTNIMNLQIQICVRNEKCIKTILEVKYSG